MRRSKSHRPASNELFFQAEDGIRAVAGTGVPACALPISPLGLHAEREDRGGRLRQEQQAGRAVQRVVALHRSEARSEERRVGKEGRYRWSAYHEEKDT